MSARWSIRVHAHERVPRSIANELGFDLEEVSSSLCHHRGRKSRSVSGCGARANQISGIGTCTSDAAVLGDECLMGVIPLEGMELVVDPVRQRVMPESQTP